MVSKQQMIKRITEARHKDPDFFYCVVNVNTINDMSDRILKQKIKKDLEELYKESIMIIWR